MSSEQLNQHPEGHPNSIAWLLWHTGREIDVQLSALTSNDELWYSSQYRAALAFGDAIAHLAQATYVVGMQV